MWPGMALWAMGVGMPDLLAIVAVAAQIRVSLALKRAWAPPSSGELRQDDYNVIAERCGGPHYQACGGTC